jgi:cytochrome d ubiquinol oxidase subunit I
MIAIGVALTTIALFACWCWWTARLWDTQAMPMRAFLLLLVLCPFMAQIATQAGWFTAEMGRQPWVVYQVLKTGDASSAVVHAAQVLRSIILFLMIYLLLTVLFVSLLARKIKQGPIPVDASPGEPPPSGFKWLSMRSRRQTSI